MWWDAWRIWRQDQTHLSAASFELGSSFDHDHFIRIIAWLGVRIVRDAQDSLPKSRLVDFNFDSVVMNNDSFHC